jgi:hypothetical protein
MSSITKQEEIEKNPFVKFVKWFAEEDTFLFCGNLIDWFSKEKSKESTFPFFCGEFVNWFAEERTFLFSAFWKKYSKEKRMLGEKEGAVDFLNWFKEMYVFDFSLNLVAFLVSRPEGFIEFCMNFVNWLKKEEPERFAILLEKYKNSSPELKEEFSKTIRD